MGTIIDSKELLKLWSLYNWFWFNAQAVEEDFVAEAARKMIEF